MFSHVPSRFVPVLWQVTHIIVFLCGFASVGISAPDESLPPSPAAPLADNRFELVEYFTAYTLAPGEIKIGTEFEIAPLASWMIGTDLFATAIGAPTLQTKWQVWQQGPHAVALGLRGAYLSEKTLLWGSFDDHFETLDAKIIRPSVSWSNRLSSRLVLHTFWAVGLGRVSATLTEQGRRKLWESKHPGGDYETRETRGTDELSTESGGSSSKANQERSPGTDSYAQRSLQVQSLTGLMTDMFQITGEFERRTGKKILLTSRFERMELEDLRSRGVRLTAAQQWIWEHFQIRLGVGVQYQVISGRDLDGEEIDEAGFLPASDIDFYWRF